jgi:RNA polymerase primary sigma factor
MEEKNIDSVNEYFKSVSDFVKKIDRNEEVSLWKKAKKGDKNARERLLQMHLRLVVPTAKRFCRRGVEFMDLIEEGNLGLLQAIDKFDPARGYRFSTYAIHWIEQYIRRAVEEQSGTIKIPSHAWDNLRAWSKAWDALKEKLGREPSLKEMSVKMNISARQVRSILDTLNAAYSVDSISSAVNEEEDITLEDTLTDVGKGNPDYLLTNSSFNTELLAILDGINPRDKEILIMRYGINSENIMTLSEVSRKLGISRERVRQIEERAVRTVRKKAEALGLFEKRDKDYSTRKIYAGMNTKEKTDILGDVIGSGNLAKMLKAHKVRGGVCEQESGKAAFKKTAGPARKQTNKKISENKKKSKRK